MKKLSLLAAVALVLAACGDIFAINRVRGNGIPAEKVFELQSFNSIKVSGSLDVVFSQGPQKVVLTADENLLDIFDISVVEGALKVSVKNWYSYSTKLKVVLNVSAPDLNGVKISGSGDCDIRGGLKTDGPFSFTVSGSGDLEADSIVCDGFSARVSGSGDIDVDKLSAKSADIEINGSGDVELICFSVGDIKVKINGSGDVSLAGTARSLYSKVNGSGNVKSHGLVLSGKQ